jgi:hypothetical protein
VSICTFSSPPITVYPSHGALRTARYPRRHPSCPPIRCKYPAFHSSVISFRNVCSAFAKGGAKAFGAELGEQTRIELGKEWAATVKLTGDWGDTWSKAYNASAFVTGDWGSFWSEAHSVVAQIIPDLSQFPQWL